MLGRHRDGAEVAAYIDGLLHGLEAHGDELEDGSGGNGEGEGAVQVGGGAGCGAFHHDAGAEDGLAAFIDDDTADGDIVLRHGDQAGASAKDRGQGGQKAAESDACKYLFHISFCL